MTSRSDWRSNAPRHPLKTPCYFVSDQGWRFKEGMKMDSPLLLFRLTILDPSLVRRGAEESDYFFVKGKTIERRCWCLY